MKKRIIQYGVAIFVLLFSVVSYSALSAQEAVRFGCEPTQRYLKNIQKPRDLHTRVDRLQAYRYIHQRLDVFARRVERNSQPNAKNLRVNVDRLHDVIEAFRLNYESYDKARDAVVSVKDCAKNSDQFTEKLQKAREEREVVAQDVALLRSIIATNIPEQLKALELQLEQKEDDE